MLNQLRWYAGRLIQLLREFLVTARNEGARAALEKGTSVVASRRAKRLTQNYPRWFGAQMDRRLAAAKRGQTGPTISVVVPIFRPEVDHLRICLESVSSQIYENWELILVDDHSDDPDVTALLEAIDQSDNRVTHISLPENRGIAMATQAGLDAATGEYVCFLDHDDSLTVDALALAAERLNTNDSIDFVYGDEDKLLANGKLGEPSFRPGRNEDLLLAYNYLSHPIAVRTSLLRSVGAMRAGFEGSQDHDLVLRLADAGATFAHIPAIVYHWRVTPASAAGSLHAKPYAPESGRLAVTESLERRGVNASVRLGRVPGHYEVLFQPPEQANLAIIVNSARNPKKILEGLRYAIDPDVGGLKIKVLIVQPAWSSDGSKPKSGWPKAWKHIDGEIITYVGWPNAAAALNQAAAQADAADAFLFVDDDVQVVDRRVVEQLLGGLWRPDVGVVGAREVGPDGAVRQSGIIVHDGQVEYAYAGQSSDRTGHHDLAMRMRDVSAASASFLVTERETFLAAGGFPEDFPNYYFDVVYCDRVRSELGRRVVVDPTFPVLKAGEGRLASAGDKASDYERIALAGFLSGTAGMPDPFFGHGDPALIPQRQKR